MKLDSKLFDRIRIRPRNYEEPRQQAPRCAWEGCDQPGIYRAPKGNRALGEYHNFCLEHVRHYNTAFNFFEGMSAQQMEEHLHRSAETDGRPSWGFGARPGAGAPRYPRGAMHEAQRKGFADPLNIFARYNWQQSRDPRRERARPIHEPDRRALETLGFSGHAPAAEIKMAYKRLVKKHHPDANGGDKSSEERLRAIIAAYSHLKAKGFVGN
ncbi:MAG TPA: DnaJ domain-containing protein [Alphaproteobacteria bacterium]|nr:DnaJ domain-containing protein [Alphaproteobacteria bacterium]